MTMGLDPKTFSFPLPAQPLGNLLEEYVMARSRGISGLGCLDKWGAVIDGITDYARSAIEAYAAALSSQGGVPQGWQLVPVEADLAEMVNRFLAWPLPASVCADAVASAPGAQHRSGTNLLTAVEARKMFEHCLQCKPVCEANTALCDAASETGAEPVAMTTISLTELPPLHGALADGKFAGVTTLTDGTHHAVVLLDAKPERRLNWERAKAWANGVGGQLPSRAIAMLLYATCKSLVPADWYWTGEPEGASYAWCCFFINGYVNDGYRRAEGAALAVRLIPLTA